MLTGIIRGGLIDSIPALVIMSNNKMHVRGQSADHLEIFIVDNVHNITYFDNVHVFSQIRIFQLPY